MKTAAEKPVILAIESSCDETSAAVLSGTRACSNVIAGQKIHEKYGGVVPELASRAHQSHIVPVVHQALEEGGYSRKDLDAIAFTQGPGLMGSLHVGVSFAKSMGLALGIPLLAVHHMQAHVLAHFIENGKGDSQAVPPAFPFLCLTVSGGHSQIVRVDGPLDMRVIGETRDDAAGEAFDKAARVLGLPYPGGPQIDRCAREGDKHRFSFPHPQVPGLDYSFSGLKTSLLYFLRDHSQKDPAFIEKNRADICASYQNSLVSFLLSKLEKAGVETGITRLALAGGVSANGQLRSEIQALCDRRGWKAWIPPFEFCTDNAAMIGITGYYLYQAGRFAGPDFSPKPRMGWGELPEN